MGYEDFNYYDKVMFCFYQRWTNHFPEVSFISVILVYTSFLMKVLHRDLSALNDSDFIDDLDEYIRKVPPPEMELTKERETEISIICERVAEIWQKSFPKWTIGSVLSNFIGCMLSEGVKDPMAVSDSDVLVWLMLFAQCYGN